MISLNLNYTICSSLCPESAVDIMWKIKQDLLFTHQVKTGLSYVKHRMSETLEHSLSNIPLAVPPPKFNIEGC